MSLATLVVLVTVVGHLSACEMTADVNTGTNRLFLTCECRRRADYPIHRFTQLQINQKTRFRKMVHLATLYLNRYKLDKVAQGFTVHRNETSADGSHMLFTLALDVDRSLSLQFQCIVMGDDQDGWSTHRLLLCVINLWDYYTTTTKITTTPSPVTTTSTQTSTTTTPTQQTTTPVQEEPTTETTTVTLERKLTESGRKEMKEKSVWSSSILMVIIGLFVFFFLIGITVIIVTLCRHRQRRSVPVHPPPPCRPPNDGALLEMMKHVVEAMTSSDHKRVTVSPSDSMETVSESYAKCYGLSPLAGSVTSPPFVNHDVTATDCLDVFNASFHSYADVSSVESLYETVETSGIKVVVNQPSAVREHETSSETSGIKVVVNQQSALRGHETSSEQQPISVKNLNRSLPPLPPESSPPPTGSAQPKQLPLLLPTSTTAQISSFSHRQGEITPPAPPSPELQLLPVAPLPSRDLSHEPSLPPEGQPKVSPEGNGTDQRAVCPQLVRGIKSGRQGRPQVMGACTGNVFRDRDPPCAGQNVDPTYFTPI